jgi:hypothetical protein
MIQLLIIETTIFDDKNNKIGRKESLFGLITIRKIMYGKNKPPKINSSK